MRGVRDTNSLIPAPLVRRDDRASLDRDDLGRISNLSPDAGASGGDTAPLNFNFTPAS
jgi:hypothetical protein